MKRLRWQGIAAIAAASLAALPAAASANVLVGSSGWQWGNPLPQGNTLRAMSFNGTTGYAVGDFGTLLQTGDGGVTWTGLPAGTFSNLTAVQAVDADTVIAGGGCVMRRSDDAGRTFSRIAFTPVESSCPQNIQSFWFVNDRLGYLVLADGTVFQTPDGGETTAPKTAVPGTKAAGGPNTPTDVRFLTDTTGFVATSDGKIFQTTDGGTTWKPVSDTNRGVRALTFVDATTGYAVGDGSLFLKTTDGGATWTPKDIGAPASQDMTDVSCASATLCVASTRTGSVLVRTADGGTTFTFPSPSTDAMLASGFASPTRLVAAGALGSTVVSDDGGQNFTPIGGRLVGQFSRIRAGAVPGTAFAPGPNGTLGKTVDAGRTWSRGNVSTSEDVLDVSFPTANDGFALDVAGGLFRTANGGGTWKPLDTGTTARPNAVWASSPTTVLIVGPTGMRRSTDGGTAFTTLHGDAVARTRLDGIDRAGSKALVAWGFQDVVRSTDGGKTWSTVRKPGKYVKKGKKQVNTLGIKMVDFADAKTGYLLDVSGRLWRTANAGKSWTELTGVGTEGGYGMSFSSTKKGYLVVDRFGDVRTPTGFLLRTDDGGATWHPQFVVSSRIPPLGVAATSAGTDFLLGGASSLLFSTTGGDQGSASTLTISTKSTKLKKPARIQVTGKLKPAIGNERIAVSMRAPGSTRWQAVTTKAAATGTFTTTWNLRAKGTYTFVAQWQGDFKSRGDGSPVLTVTVGKK